jgi:hypothetical protein
LRFRKSVASGLPPPKKYSLWKSVDEVRNFFETFSESHLIKNWPEDWYRISVKQVELAGGSSYISFSPSLLPFILIFLQGSASSSNTKLLAKL